MQRKFIKFREERNLSVRDVAQKIEYPVGAINKVEFNFVEAEHIVIKSLCWAYHVSLEEEVNYSDHLNYVHILSHEHDLVHYHQIQQEFIKLREKCKLSKTKIAEKAGISVLMLNRIESDISQVAQGLIMKLCKFYRVDFKKYH